MKKLILLIAALLVASSAYGANPSYIGFRGYSAAAATPTKCTVIGMRSKLATDDNGVPMQGFAPSPGTERTLNLGTKGLANYSTLGLRAVQFTCVTQATASVNTPGTISRVKVFFNKVETWFLTLAEGIFYIGQ